MPGGFGYLPLIANYDPTIFFAGTTLTTKLVPTSEEINQAKYLDISGENPALQSIKETVAHGVSDITNEA
jgi:hypothetical protein